LFLHRHSVRYDDWFGVIIFGSRNLEPSNLYIHRSLLATNQVHRVYLDELGDVQDKPLGLGLMLLTVKEDEEAVAAAQYLLSQVQVQADAAIIDLVTTIILYKFGNLTQEEIITMLGLDLEEPRALRDAREKGKEEGRIEGKEEGRVEGEKLIVVKLLNRRLGVVIPDELLSQVQELSLEQIENLGEALLDFASVADLERWLAQNTNISL
jgi:predicted transposase YdaD